MKYITLTFSILFLTACVPPDSAGNKKLQEQIAELAKQLEQKQNTPTGLTPEEAKKAEELAQHKKLQEQIAELAKQLTQQQSTPTGLTPEEAKKLETAKKIQELRGQLIDIAQKINEESLKEDCDPARLNTLYQKMQLLAIQISQRGEPAGVFARVGCIRPTLSPVPTPNEEEDTWEGI